MGVHSITRILQHLLSTIFTSHHHHQPRPPTEPSDHNSMSSRHVKSFHNIRIHLLPFIVVTFATSHWLRSPLKAIASRNTVARKDGRLHSQSTHKKEGGRKSPDHNTVTAQTPDYIHSLRTRKKANILQSTYNSMSSRHVKSFHNIRIHLLPSIVVTFATSHWLRSPLKTEASRNTVARKDGRLHSQSTHKKEGGRKSSDHNTVTAQTRQTFFKVHTSLQQPKLPSEPPWITQSMFRSRYVIVKHIDVMHTGDTNQTTSTQTLLSPNALPRSPIITTQPTFISPANEPPNLHTHKTTQRHINHPVHSIARIL